MMNVQIRKKRQKRKESQPKATTSSADSNVKTAENDFKQLSEKLKSLESVLGDNFAEYFRKMKLWIQCEISRGDFEQEIFEYFNFKTIADHHEFIASFLKHIHSKSKTIKYYRKSVTNPTLPSTSSSFNNMEISDVEEYSFNSTQDNIQDLNLKKMLPDEETLYGILILNVWEKHVYNIDKNIVSWISTATETIVKNILDAALARKFNEERQIFESQPSSCNDETTSSTKRLKLNAAENLNVKISVQDIQGCLLVQPNLIPIKSVYQNTLNKIRIL